jgi:AcrR family transcriptional regulator
LHEHREQVRSRLFAALAELVAEKGFDAVTLAQIAERAGVGRTAVYNHFADKEAMLVGLIMHETMMWTQTLEAALEGVEDPVERLRTYIREQLCRKPEFHFVPGPDLRQVVSAQTLTKVRVHVTIVANILREILTDGMARGAFPAIDDIDTAVPLVMSCLSGRTVGPDRQSEEAVAVIEGFILRALGGPASAAGAAQAGGLSVWRGCEPCGGARTAKGSVTCSSWAVKR